MSSILTKPARPRRRKRGYDLFLSRHSRTGHEHFGFEEDQGDPPGTGRVDAGSLRGRSGNASSFLMFLTPYAGPTPRTPATS